MKRATHRLLRDGVIPNHFQMLRPVISGIASRGIDARVFTHLRLAREVERAGATFVDLYAGRPLEAADDESVPLPTRYVSFAGRFADELVAEVEALDAELIVYASFSVIAWVAGRILGSAVACSLGVGHDITPARYLPRLESDPRVDLSPRCLQAVESSATGTASMTRPLRLHLRHQSVPQPPSRARGVPLATTSDRAFEPVAFFGSLPAMDETSRQGAAKVGARPSGTARAGPSSTSRSAPSFGGTGRQRPWRRSDGSRRRSRRRRMFTL